MPHRLDLVGIGAAQPRQPAQDPVDLLGADVEAGEVARQHAVAEAAHQRLPLEERVGQYLPGRMHPPIQTGRAYPPQSCGTALQCLHAAFHG